MNDSEFLSMALTVVSGLLSLLGGLLWYQWRGALSRIERLGQAQGDLMAQVARLEEGAINKDQLVDLLDKTIEKHTRPLTSELKAIRADQVEARKARQETRERLIRLEALE